MGTAYRYLERVADKLCRYSDFIANPGLSDGKTGVSIFLFRFARLTGNEGIEAYAEKLLDDVLEELPKVNNFDFDAGLCGIGYAIDYLMRNGFVEADSDTLEELDGLILSATENEGARVSQDVSAAKYWLQRGNEEQFSLVTNKVVSYLIKRVGEASEVPHDDFLTFPLFLDLALFHMGRRITPGRDVRKLYEILAGTKDKKHIQWHLGRNYRIVKEIDRLFRPDPSEPGCRFFSGDLWTDDVTLSNLLRFRDNFMQYKISYPEEVTLPKVRRILDEEDLLDEWLDLALPRTMNIGHNMTGFGWVLLDMFDLQLLKS